MQAAQVAQKQVPNDSCSNHISARFLSKDISKLKKDAASILKMSSGQRLEEVEI